MRTEAHLYGILRKVFESSQAADFKFYKKFNKEELDTVISILAAWLPRYDQANSESYWGLNHSLAQLLTYLLEAKVSKEQLEKLYEAVKLYLTAKIDNTANKIPQIAQPIFAHPLCTPAIKESIKSIILAAAEKELSRGTPPNYKNQWSPGDMETFYEGYSTGNENNNISHALTLCDVSKKFLLDSLEKFPMLTCHKVSTSSNLTILEDLIEEMMQKHTVEKLTPYQLFAAMKFSKNVEFITEMYKKFPKGMGGKHQTIAAALLSNRNIPDKILLKESRRKAEWSVSVIAKSEKLANDKIRMRVTKNIINNYPHAMAVRSLFSNKYFTYGELDTVYQECKDNNIKYDLIAYGYNMSEPFLVALSLREESSMLKKAAAERLAELHKKSKETEEE